MREKRVSALLLIGVIALATMVISLLFLKTFHRGKQRFTQEHEILKRLHTGDLAQEITYETFRAIAKQMNPAVVNIYTARPRGNPMQDPSIRRFFGFGEQPHPDALGSGVVIDSDGLILTNNHVVENA
ncbi:MAG TPA: hypothetical protein VJ521_00910, partial [Acidobacteriota bacterium]|nr:hypothetical protein [Acidobacteriota bacterium]